MIEREIKIPVEVTPQEAAFEFCNWDSVKQAAFFNEISELTTKWERPFCFQLQSIADIESLTDGGRDVMESIGEYGEETRKSNNKRSSISEEQRLTTINQMTDHG